MGFIKRAVFNRLRRFIQKALVKSGISPGLIGQP
jgi:hypothetical protein